MDSRIEAWRAAAGELSSAIHASRDAQGLFPARLAPSQIPEGLSAFDGRIGYQAIPGRGGFRLSIPIPLDAFGGYAVYSSRTQVWIWCD